MSPDPQCLFTVRIPAGNGKWWYQRITVRSPIGGNFIPMAHVPDIGDTVTLHSERPVTGGPAFRVVSRNWSPAAWGSVNWPLPADAPIAGPIVDIIVEPADSPYADETAICSNESCEAVLLYLGWVSLPGADEPAPHTHTPYQSEAGS